VTVAEADIGHLKAGQSARFTVDAWPSRVYLAKVLKVAFGSTTTNNVVTYETELDVANEDLSLRPGMTATAEILAAESKGAFIVPASALRFSPKAPDDPSAAAPKKSFVQSIVPMPPRMNRGNKPATDEAGPNALKAGESRIWVLEDGHPEPIYVKTGISQSGKVEILGEKLAEGMQLITRQN
jgi:HlyD family secretion protein